MALDAVGGGEAFARRWVVNANVRQGIIVARGSVFRGIFILGVIVELTRNPEPARRAMFMSVRCSRNEVPKSIISNKKSKRPAGRS